jgi:hypothetical protein
MKERYGQTMFERVQACNEINKLANKQRMCDRKFIGKMI